MNLKNVRCYTETCFCRLTSWEKASTQTYSPWQRLLSRMFGTFSSKELWASWTLLRLLDEACDSQELSFEVFWQNFFFFLSCFTFRTPQWAVAAELLSRASRKVSTASRNCFSALLKRCKWSSTLPSTTTSLLTLSACWSSSLPKMPCHGNFPWSSLLSFPLPRMLPSLVLPCSPLQAVMLAATLAERKLRTVAFTPREGKSLSQLF